MSRIFEFLFKYRPLVYEQGEFVFGAPGSFRTLLIVGGLIGAAAVASYTLARGKSSVTDRGVMAGLRVTLLAILVFALMQPALRLSTVVPQQNFVGVLIDDSRSMELADGDGVTRAEVVADLLAPEGGELLTALGERFTLRFFRFSDIAERIDGPGELGYDGTHTDLAGALDLARQELAGVPLSGLVMLSDGADNEAAPLTEALVPLQASGVPVFTVGLGEETISPDIELGRVEMPRTILEGSSLLVDVVVSQTGFGRRSVPLIVEDEIEILAEETIELGDDGEPVVARVHFELDRAGPRKVRFRVPLQDGERVRENNLRDVQIEVLGEREKILYFEGEPRWEVKFVRRAVAHDENLQLVVLQRTAPGKFMRMEVDDGAELEFGFPLDREELYRYRALIIGSVEASFFTHDQLQMIADFVSERGGGLLMLGGGQAFAEGGWAGTPVEEVMPIVLGDPTGGSEYFFEEVKVEPTPTGLGHAAIQLGLEGQAVRAKWDSLPPVTIVNPIHEVRPGASTLLRGVGDRLAEDQVVLAYQRYGRGKSVVFTAQDSWLWQMHYDVPLEDESHEDFWQQLVRWLVDGVPETVVAVADREQVEAGEAVRLVATVGDSTYIEINDASVTAKVTGPTGVVEEYPVEWTVDRDGEYDFQFRPQEDGEYEIEITAMRGESVLGSDVTYIHTAPSTDEYFGAGRHTQLLRRIADETGGQYYTPDEVGTLADDITVTGAGVTLVEDLDLWDMPAIFFLLLMVMAAEWGFRRMRGLV